MTRLLFSWFLACAATLPVFSYSRAADDGNVPLHQLVDNTGSFSVHSSVLNPAAPTAPLAVRATYERYWVVVKASGPEERTKIANTGMSIEEIYSDKIAGIANDEHIKELEKLGFEIESIRKLSELLTELTKSFPYYDRAYHDYAETGAMLSELQKANPGFVSLFSIGKTWQKRDIWALRFNTSASGAGQSGKPGAVFMGTHHAREHLSTEVPLLFAKYLCDNKDKPEVAKLLASLDIYIIPMVNPDGVEYDISDGKYKLFRKNMRVNPGGSFGVDINRNYDYLWGGPDAPSDPNDETYRGPAPFSEPESRAVKRFFESRSNLKTFISFHTYGEMVLYPWGGRNSPITNSKDLSAYKNLARSMGELTGYKPMQSCRMYLAGGDAADWVYANRGVFSFTFELEPKRESDSSFYPGGAMIGKIIGPNISAMMYLLNMTGNPYKAVDDPSKAAEMQEDPSPAVK